MATTFSFDVVSKVDVQELKNAIENAKKEVSQRYDLKGSKNEILFEQEKEIVVTSDDEFKLSAVIEILKSKLFKRGISLKSLDFGEVEKALGGNARQHIQVQQGIAADKAKAIGKTIRDAKLKAQAQIQGDQLRVSSKSKDALQAVIQLLKTEDFGIDLQFINYR
ncbi:MAG: YajQ family cyclic di-GMP-binding protein [Nitrospiria bacterium]